MLIHAIIFLLLMLCDIDPQVGSKMNGITKDVIILPL